MIKNERQYRLTRAQLGRFQEALDCAERELPSDLSEEMKGLYTEALRTQMQELMREITEYESLRAGSQDVAIRDISELPVALIRARIARGLSQKELADSLGIAEQQIQRYEASNYLGAGLERVLSIAGTLGLQLSRHLTIPTLEDFTRILKSLSAIGLPKSLLLNRVVPQHLRRALVGSDADSGAVSGALGAIAMALGVDANALLVEPPCLEPAMLSLAVKYKLPTSTKSRGLGAYTLYVSRLAQASAHLFDDIPSRQPPESPDEVLRAIETGSGGMSFRGALRYAWDMGLVVLPLSDRGFFHGACFRVDGRNVIVLKQADRSESRWLFDLLHEMFHAFEQPTEPDLAVIEPACDSEEARSSDSEKAANEFAGLVSLRGHAAQLLDQVITGTGGRIERFKSVVPSVAAAAGVPAGLLANYCAHRLWAERITNWWGAAANLQDRTQDPHGTCLDEFLSRAAFGRLGPFEQSLLSQALQPLEV